MVFYDCHGNKQEFDLSYSIGKGFCGEAFRYEDDWVLKIYRESCSRYLRLKKIIYDELKDINSPNIVEIDNLLFRKEIDNYVFLLCSYLFKKSLVDAYTCKYVAPAAIDLLTTPSDYLIDNMYELSRVFTELSKRNIRTVDVKANNAIMQKDKIVLIDLDLFHKVFIGGKKLESINQKNLLGLFKELVMDSVWCYNHDRLFIDSITQIFDPYQFSNGSDIVVETAKQFKKYKYPIDYINEYTKNRL